ncbi:hypothetical protein K438DRAFT_1720930 [Mycena galopus ATCC 62051]|nr:hypothetical protein K438DRAFT_1720930 [Mycena galopus ATCC 62051]
MIVSLVVSIPGARCSWASHFVAPVSNYSLDLGSTEPYQTPSRSSMTPPSLRQIPTLRWRSPGRSAPTVAFRSRRSSRACQRRPRTSPSRATTSSCPGMVRRTPYRIIYLLTKIRGLINSLPTLSSRFLPSPKDPPALDADGRPIPPPGAVRIQDPELITFLSNPDVMNGSDVERQSVWSMLEGIRPPESIDESCEYAGSDRSSVMMYSPLIPNADSVIELADVEEVSVVQSGTPSSGWFTSWPDWSSLWLFNGWKARNPTEEHITSPPIPITISAPETEPHNETGEERRVAPVRRVWVPSSAQLSFETTWWGYRMYLPPPVLATLDDQSVEAAQQATVITAALTWFFTNLPVSTFPPPLQPAMILLQKLVPLVSYLGTFISWSWGTIRSFDQGHGVILTVTWLLPIALIPGTCHARDVPPPPSPASESAVVSLEVVPMANPDEDLELSIPLPPAPAPAIKPLPPCPDEPPILAPPLKQRKSSTSTGGKSKIKTLRKLTRTFT